MTDLSLAAAAFARADVLAYAIGSDRQYRVGKHHRLIADALMDIERGVIDRLMISVPPRHGKSHIASNFFPAWYLGRHPDRQVIFATYSQEFANTWGRKVRNQMSEPLFRAAFPDCKLADDSQAANRFNTSAGGIYFATGVGGPMTGLGADLMVLDDLTKNREEADSKTYRDKAWDWFTSTAYTRLMPGGAIVAIATRWHEDDILGRILKHEGHKWRVINLPAVACSDDDPLGRAPGEPLWPDQYSIQALEQIKQTIGSRDWSALYQQDPRNDEGALIKREWIRQAERAPYGAVITLGVDLAISEREGADYTAVVAMARDEVGKIYVVDAVRERLPFAGVIKLIRAMAEKHKPAVIGIEQVQFQAAVVQELLATTSLPVRGVRPDRDKKTRALPLALRYEQGMVLHCALPSWFEDELTAFPLSEHDDAVDAAVYAYQQLDAAASQSGVGVVTRPIYVTDASGY